MTYDAYEPRQMLTGIFFTAATGEVVVSGSSGADVARVSQVNNTVTVTLEGVDTRSFAASDIDSVVFIGQAGDDFFENQTAIFANAIGQGGNDTLIGGSGADRLVGNTGDDTIEGNGGDDVIVAGNGDDVVDAGTGNDRVLGVRGFNTIEAGTGDDLVFGGEDVDIISVISGNNTLVGFSGNDTIRGGSGEDLIFGGLGDDTITGAAGDDRIYAQGGDDFLSGGAGFDIVSGNDGNDTLQGAQGNDRIVGGAGIDTVNFSGSLISYDVTGLLGTVLFVDDLRGPNFGLEDTVLTVEDFQFADGLRTGAEALNPVVNPPGANVREVVFVQPIITANSDGSNQAEFFGTSAQQADIINLIDEIFAQANIDIEFLPEREFNDTFTNVGDGNGTRTGGDLSRIISRGDANGVGNSDRNVIDLYFVETVPGFGDVGNNTANGLAFVGAAGAAVHVGDNLVNFGAGRDTIAAVTAHEIAHNLGLGHVGGSNNLLSETGSSTALNNSQISTINNSFLSQPVSTSATLVTLDPATGEVLPQDGGGCGGCGVCAACAGV